VLIDDEITEAIAQLTDLAPLHQPRALAGIAATRQALPDLPAVACFDTAFHADMPAAAARYALPAAWTQRFGLRRFGFHGLSHGYAARRAAQLLDRDEGTLRVVTCHLGAGASLAAVRGGRSVDTTMGFTPLEGLVMATRSGSVDPGLIVWLLQHGHLGLEEVAAGLEQSSGLAGLSGQAGGDIRDVQGAAGAGDPAAALAIEVYLHRLRREIAAMAAAMDGLDAIVFTGGVGEHNPAVRAAAAAGLGFLGIGVDPGRNQATADAVISGAGALVSSLVVTAREDIEIARQARDVLLRTS
jgi:acetate kinase